MVKSVIPILAVLTAASCGNFGRTSDSDRWDAVYSRKDFDFNTKPNAFLAQVLDGRKPGKALDIGMGQGRNAIYMAQMGWEVTGVDISEKGIDLARKQAADLGLKLTAVKAPIEEYDMGKGRWDLIVAIYVHGPLVHSSARVMEALKPGGLLVVEGFHRDVMKTGAQPVSGGQVGFETNALLKTFSALRIERYQDTIAFGDWVNREAPIIRMLARKE